MTILIFICKTSGAESLERDIKSSALNKAAKVLRIIPAAGSSPVTIVSRKYYAILFRIKVYLVYKYHRSYAFSRVRTMFL